MISLPNFFGPDHPYNKFTKIKIGFYLWSSKNENRPSWFHLCFPRSSITLNLPNNTHSPLHRSSKINVNILQILHKLNLIPIPRKQGTHFPIIHTPINSPL